MEDTTNFSQELQEIKKGLASKLFKEIKDGDNQMGEYAIKMFADEIKGLVYRISSIVGKTLETTEEKCRDLGIQLKYLEKQAGKYINDPQKTDMSLSPEQQEEYDRLITFQEIPFRLSKIMTHLDTTKNPDDNHRLYVGPDIKSRLDYTKISVGKILGETIKIINIIEVKNEKVEDSSIPNDNNNDNNVTTPKNKNNTPIDSGKHFKSRKAIPRNNVALQGTSPIVKPNDGRKVYHVTTNATGHAPTEIVLPNFIKGTEPNTITLLPTKGTPINAGRIIGQLFTGLKPFRE